MLFMKRKTKRTVSETEQKTFGQRLCRLRKAKGLTQGELGSLLGVSVRALSAYERNECKPSVHVVASLAQHLGIGLEELLGLATTNHQDTPVPSRRWAKRFKQIETLSGRKQHAIMQVLDMALKSTS